MSTERDYILVYINSRRLEIRTEYAFMNLSDYLRYEQQLTGTKIVCAEGDCGACTVLSGAVSAGKEIDDICYRAINSCIAPMHSLDCCHIISIEGLNQVYQDKLHPIQTSMVAHHGTQCGFCTPGFVMAIAGMLEQQKNPDANHARNYLTGNLCRCTGYQSIIDSVVDIDTNNYQSIKSHYHNQSIHDELLTAAQIPVTISHKNISFSAPISAAAVAKQLKPQQQSRNKQVFAAATDLGVSLNKDIFKPQNAISLHLIPELYRHDISSDNSKIGARVTIDQIQHKIKAQHPEFSEFLNIFASPQIRNNATLVGNIANGSPVADSLPFLMVMDSIIIIQGPKGVRKCNINQLYTGYKQLDLAADEFIAYVEIPHKATNTKLGLYKVSQRRDLDISCVAAAFKLQFDAHNALSEVAIALGGVAATVLRIPAIEQQLIGLSMAELLEPKSCQAIAEQISESVTPLFDVRGSDKFRRTLVANLYKKFIFELSAGQQHEA